MKGAATSISGVGTAADKTSKQTDHLSDTTTKSGKTFKQAAVGVGKWVASAALVAKGVHYMHDSIETTEGLAKSTIKLSRTTGMSTETSSAWAEIAKTRNIDATALNRGLVTLSKQMTSAAGGTKTAVQTFKALGISMDTIRAGDTNSVIMQSADALSKMTNPAERAALAQKLFARQGQELLPVLMGGSKGINEQIDAAKRYGAVIGDDGVKHTKELAAQQRELKMASDGLKISVGSALVPVLLQLTTMLSGLAAVMQPVLRNSTALRIIIGTLVTAFLAYKVAVIASTIASMSLVGVWALIPLAIAAIVVGLVLLWRKTTIIQSAFRAVGNAAKAVWGWIKGNWPLLAAVLAGPFGLAVAQIAKHWDKIKAGARALVGWFKGFGGSVVRAIVDGIKSAPGAILDALKSLLPGGTIAAKLGHKIGLWQHGGVVPHAQLGVVGERGPELVQMPGGTRITPLPTGSRAVAPSLGGGASMLPPIVTHVYLDRRMIATAVAEDTADRKARR